MVNMSEWNNRINYLRQFTLMDKISIFFYSEHIVQPRLKSRLCAFIAFNRSNPYTYTYRIMHALFHTRTVIIPRDRYRPEGFSPRVDIRRGMITVLKWKKACINLFITYFNIELKRTKLTSHTDTKLIWIRVFDISWGMITVLLWKKSCIDIFIERLDIVLSYFCPHICPWDDIAVALPHTNMEVRT